MMSILRLLYLVCWRNRLLIPLIISCATFAMVVTMFYHGSSEEPSIVQQSFLSQRHKWTPREPQKNHHRATDDDGNGTPHAEPLAESIGAAADSGKIHKAKKPDKLGKKKKTGSNIPDTDDLEKKLSDRINKNHGKHMKDNVAKKPAKNEGVEHVINPEQRKHEVGLEKWRRNRPNIESNILQLPNSKKGNIEFEPQENKWKKAEKRVNNFLVQDKLGKSNDYFKVAQGKQPPIEFVHIKKNMDHPKKKKVPTATLR